MKTLITRIKRLALALCLAAPVVSWAAEPAAVWDGDFTATQTGYNLNRSGNALSQDNSTITIDQSVGVKVDFTTGFSDAMTVMFKYSDLTFDAQKTLATSFCSGGDENRTGVYAANGGTINGIWNTANWNNPMETLSESSGMLAFCYSKNGGTSLYYISADGTRTQLYKKDNLKAGSDNAINGCTIGGERAKSGATLLGAATGMKITALAIFNGILTEADMTGYVWPSEIETVSVDADTTVAAINTLIAGVDAGAKKVVVDVADGVTIDVDTAFVASKPTTIASEGDVTLSAETQPDASYFSAVDFDVKGALLRSWLTPGVVGFNFYKNKGNDTTDALATGTWYSDANSKTGTSTELFSDGLSVLSWNCSTLYSQGGYYDQTGEEGTLLNGYLDDGSLNGNGAEVYLTNVPYETYDVIIYAASDTANANFLAKTVNGTTYTWDTATGSAVEGNAAWGKAALNTPVYGVNALRIKNLTGALTIYGTAKTGSPRGGISAIQIMPPSTPDNIRTYKLTLNGTDTTWTNGAWTLNDQSVEAPTAGYVEIDASASTVVTVDTAVSVASLTINGSEDVVVSIVTAGEEGSSFSTIGATVAGGVFKQGVANSVTGLVTVENGGTFDMNGLANGAALVIAGAGAGNWPWALGSSSGEVSLSTPPTLTGNAAIGGAGKIVLGASGGATAFPLGGFTLTKSGAGELYCYNVRTDNGTLDVAGGTLSFNQWTALDGSETIDRHTTVIVRNGAELKNNAGRRLWIDTLNVEAGATVTTTASGYFGVSTAFNGTCDTTKLQFNDGAVATLDGNLTVATLVAQGDNSHTTVGSMELALATGTSAATVTVSDTVTAVGTIAVGAGVTPAFTGESDVTATLRYTSAPAAANIGYATAENWKGTFVADWAGNRSTALPLNSYGVEGSTVEVPDGQALVGYIDVRANNTLTINPTIKVTGTLQIDNGFDYSTVVYKGVEGAGTLNLSFAPSHWIKHEIQVLDNYTGTIQCSAKTVLQLDSVKLATVPEVGESIDVTLTLAEGAQVLNASGVAGKIDIVGSTNKLELNSADGKLYVVEGTVTITVPPVANATATATIGGEPVALDSNGQADVPAGAEVTVTYAADSGYQISGTTEYTIDTATATTFELDESTKTALIVAQIRTGATSYEYYTTLADALESENVAYGITLRANIDEDEVTISSPVMITGNYTINSDIKVVDGGQLQLMLVTMAGTLTIEENGIYATSGGTLSELVTKDGAKIQLTTLSDTAAPLAVTSLSVEGELTIISSWGSAVRDTYYKALSYVTANADIAEGATVDSVNEWSAKVEEEGDNTVVYLAITKVATVDGVYYDDAQDAVDAAVASGKPVSFLVAPGTVKLGDGETLVVSGSTLPTVVLDDGLEAPYEVEHTVDAVNVLNIYTVVKYVAKVKNPVYGTTAWQPEVKYTSLADAVAAVIDNNQAGYNAGYVPLVTLLDNVTLDTRVEPNKRMNIDLNGKTITREGTSGNGSVFDVKSGIVTIKNGTIDCTQDDTAIVADGVYAITARSGANVTLSELTVKVESQAGACVYPFAGAQVTILSGTYANSTAADYQYHAGWRGMAVNQANVALQLITIYGGSFKQNDPALGDDSWTSAGNGFLASGYASTWNPSTGYYDVAEVQEVPVTPGSQTEPVDTEAEAEAEAAKVVITVPAAVAEELTPAQEAAYTEMFEAKVVQVTVGETTKYAVEVVLKDSVAADIQTAVDAEAEDLATAAAAAAATGSGDPDVTTEVTTTPGLYYVVEAGSELDGIAPASCTLATGNTLVLPIPNKGTCGFYRLRVSVTPVTTPAND